MTRQQLTRQQLDEWRQEMDRRYGARRCASVKLRRRVNLVIAVGVVLYILLLALLVITGELSKTS